MGPAARDAGACPGIASVASAAKVASVASVASGESPAALSPDAEASDMERKEHAEKEAKPWPAAKTSANEKKFSA